MKVRYLVLLFLLLVESFAYSSYFSSFLKTVNQEYQKIITHHAIIFNQDAVPICQVNSPEHPDWMPQAAFSSFSTNMMGLELCTEAELNVLQVAQNIVTTNKKDKLFLKKTSLQSKGITGTAICAVSGTSGVVNELGKYVETEDDEFVKNFSAGSFLAGMITFGAGQLTEALAAEKIKKLKEQIRIIEHNVEHVLKEEHTKDWTKQERQKIKQLEKRRKIAGAVALGAICYTLSRIIVFYFTTDEVARTE